MKGETQSREAGSFLMELLKIASGNQIKTIKFLSKAGAD